MSKENINVNIKHLVDKVIIVNVGTDISTEELELKVNEALVKAIDSAILSQQDQDQVQEGS